MAIVTPYNYRRLGALAKRLRKINGLKRYVKMKKSKKKRAAKSLNWIFVREKSLWISTAPRVEELIAK